MSTVSDFVAPVVPPVLAGMFAFALGAKLRDWPAIVEWFQQLGIPRPREAAIAGLASEAAVVIVLVALPVYGLIFAVVCLVAATALLVRGDKVNAPCACFGRASGATSTWAIARNIGFVGVAVFSLIFANAPPPPLELSASFVAIGPIILLIQSLTEQ